MAMIEKNKIQENKNALSCIARAPGIVFLLVAGTDGSIDINDVDKFKELMQLPDYEILLSIMQEESISLNELLTDMQNNSLQLKEELRQLRFVVDSCLPEEIAMAYKTALISLAKTLAKVSKRLFGVFGSRIDKDGRAAITTIKLELGLLEETRFTN